MFSLDGGDSLSTFAQGSVNVDSGATGRVELSRPVALDARSHAALTPYAFGALGYGHLSDPTALEAAQLHSRSAGAGLRLQLAAPASGVASFASVEVSHGHVTTLSNDPTRVSASFSFRF